MEQSGGKTTTALQQAKSVVYMDDEEHGEENIAMARAFPGNFWKTQLRNSSMNGDSVRRGIDIRDEFRQFILTGSGTRHFLSSLCS